MFFDSDSDDELVPVQGKFDPEASIVGNTPGLNDKDDIIEPDPLLINDCVTTSSESQIEQTSVNCKLETSKEVDSKDSNPQNQGLEHYATVKDTSSTCKDEFIFGEEFSVKRTRG